MNLRRFEHALLTLGLTLCVASLGVVAYREIWSRMAIRSFEAAASGSQRIQTPVPVLEVGVAQPDYRIGDTNAALNVMGNGNRPCPLLATRSIDACMIGSHR